MRYAPVVLALVAVALHFAGLVAYAGAHGALPLSGLAPALSSLAFVVGLLAAALLWLTIEPSLVLVASPLFIGPLAIALLSGLGAPPSPDVQQGGWFMLHVALSFLGIALLGVAFVAAALYLAQHRQLKTRRFGAIFQFAPPLEQLDRLNRIALLVGFPVLTVGVALAAGSAVGVAVEPDLSLAHLIWGSLAWVVLGIIAVARFLGRLTGRRAAYASVSGFLAVALSYLLLVALLGGAGRFL